MINQIDNAVLHFFGSLQLPVLNEIMIFISSLGNSGFVWIVLAIVLLCFKKTRRAGFTVGLALIIGFIICNLWLKPIIARPRPFDAFEINLLIDAPTDWSFPSGHTVSSFAAATAVGLSLRNKWWLALIPAMLIALSRLYLQVHYLTDVLAGVIIGILAALIACWIVSLVNKKRKKQSEK